MMAQQDRKLIGRRRFLRRALGAGATVVCGRQAGGATSRRRWQDLEVGEGFVDTTPPLGIEMAGFHRAAGNERRITGIRQPTAARALVLRFGDTQAAIVSLDICGISAEFAAHAADAVGRQCGIEPPNVRITATHTHSMPTFRYFRQWGAVSTEYMATVEQRIVEAVARAKSDLAPAQLYVGRHRATGANFNRTAARWKTDAEFSNESTDAERWLDTMVHVLRFERAGGKPNVLWYHFCAHPVCYTDGNAGPDWPGLVDKLVVEQHRVTPSLLQGHIGDVNPGDGKPWLGVPETVATRVYDGFTTALSSAEVVRLKSIRLESRPIEVPLNMDLFKDQIARYEKDPEKCSSGEWVDAGFAKDWYEGAKRWDLNRATLRTTLSAIQLGAVGMLFHAAELYSFYGLAIRHNSPLPHTLVIGYTDGFIGYLTDPNAYKAGEYAATTVPKIVALPPFQPHAAQEFTAALAGLLKNIAG